MTAFRAGELDVLVATTVIEVGVDVPNATVMIIEDADRFGIAQLHQLRGRVGRGADQAWCYLLGRRGRRPSRRPGSRRWRQTTDGFELAEVDLDLRGEGTVLGTRQKGHSDLKLASPAPRPGVGGPGPRAGLRDRRRRPRPPAEHPPGRGDPPPHRRIRSRVPVQIVVLRYNRSYHVSMTIRKQRLTVTVDPALVEAGNEAVAAGLADSLSGWVNSAIAEQARRDARLRALAAAVRDYEAEHGELTSEEVDAQIRADREAAVVVRGGRQGPA